MDAYLCNIVCTHQGLINVGLCLHKQLLYVVSGVNTLHQFSKWFRLEAQPNFKS